MDNRWLKGPGTLEVPGFPDTYRGVSGCALESLTFDSNVGEETLLLLLEVPQYLPDLKPISKIGICLSPGLIRTAYGSLLFIIVHVFNGKKHVLYHETYLDPLAQLVQERLSRLSEQKYLKVLLANSSSGEIENWWELSWDHSYQDLLHSIQRLPAEERITNFARAKQGAMDTYSSEELLRLTGGIPKAPGGWKFWR